MKLRHCVGIVLLLALVAVACGPTAEPVIVSQPGGPAAVAGAETPSQPATQSAATQSTAPPNALQVGQDVSVPDEGREHVPEGYWVHTLEHGAIVVLYNCPQACPDLVKSLGDMLDSFPMTKWNNRKIVIVPYAKMSVPLMAVAWDVQMPLDQFDAQALIDFYSRHVDRGPEDVP